MNENNKIPTIAWFSCGATSAVACKIALQLYHNVRIIYIETHSCHQDNLRFIKDCESWYGQEIEIRSNSKWANVEDVIKNRRYINGVHGAPCTTELKKKVRIEVEDEIKEWNGQVWGFEFTKNEINRAIRFQEQNPRNKPLFPLIEKQLTKKDCLAILDTANIPLPAMYKLGYHNNNCIGCVKGGMGYWNKIRIDFPDVFYRMAKIERDLNSTCLHDENGSLFLDELKPERGRSLDPIVPECSIMCQIEFETLIDKRVESIIEGKKSVYL